MSSVLSPERLAAFCLAYATAGKKLYAVDAKTGEGQWEFEAESRILPTPVIANGVVYVATTKGQLYALH